MNNKTIRNDGNELTEQEIHELAEEMRDRDTNDRIVFQEKIIKQGSIEIMM